MKRKNQDRKKGPNGTFGLAKGGTVAIMLLLIISVGVVGLIGPAETVRAEDESAWIDNFEDDPSLSGDGTESDPYEITNLNELQSINDDLDAHYELMNDINATETKDWNDGNGFEPIGDDENSFTGSFDGQGHTISDIYINRSNENDIGLFGFTDGSTIENISVEDVDVSGDSNVGGLVGHNRDSSTVSNSYSTGTVSGEGTGVGGLVGHNRESSTVSNSYSTVTVSGDKRVGGLVGNKYNSEVSNSYSTGTVSGSSSLGSLVGRIYNLEGDTDEILYSYANSDINPDLDLIGAKANDGELNTTGSSLKTTAEMTDYSTFDDGGWDITTVEFGETDDNVTTDPDSYTWNIVDGDTKPFLSFEELEAPSVMTVTASNIGEDSATLEGELTEIGDTESVDVLFKYREDGDTTWNDSDSSELMEEGIFDIDIDDLDENTTYEFRAVVQWSGEEEVGDVQTFTTDDTTDDDTIVPDDIDMVEDLWDWIEENMMMIVFLGGGLIVFLSAGDDEYMMIIGLILIGSGIYFWMF